ncbi:hypothetical protein HSE3_gp036 [Bacillus phage vB_BceM-HSE3]|nr:hypothetical protein HSE3_gp036 [Bacillus phage vB_BceM-HSE3]
MEHITVIIIAVLIGYVLGLLTCAIIVRRNFDLLVLSYNTKNAETQPKQETPKEEEPTSESIGIPSELVKTRDQYVVAISQGLVQQDETFTQWCRRNGYTAYPDDFMTEDDNAVLEKHIDEKLNETKKDSEE